MTDPDLLIRRLEQAIQSMDMTPRELFLAHRLDGLSYEQIANRTGLTIAEIEQHIATAIAHIDCVLNATERQDIA